MEMKEFFRNIWRGIKVALNFIAPPFVWLWNHSLGPIFYYTGITGFCKFIAQACKNHYYYYKLIHTSVKDFKAMDPATREDLWDKGTASQFMPTPIYGKLKKLEDVIECSKGSVYFRRTQEGDCLATLYTQQKGVIECTVTFVEAGKPIRFGDKTYRYDVDNRALIDTTDNSIFLENPARKFDWVDTMRDIREDDNNRAKAEIAIFHSPCEEEQYLLGLQDLFRLVTIHEQFDFGSGFYSRELSDEYIERETKASTPDQ